MPHHAPRATVFWMIDPIDDVDRRKIKGGYTVNAGNIDPIYLRISTTLMEGINTAY
ncbi:hypothetical protein GCM10011328_33830 [Hafnia psychrotolerans]|uniref:Uncharacterized protein n=1 Tax=Hafnia psychrotolerans TaxID=1477018 RepID=A0ABQ1H3G5_9GAMM|nr:hypothetical protein GCM10011328_33830 [Hafnia psychrotolerans]